MARPHTHTPSPPPSPFDCVVVAAGAWDNAKKWNEKCASEGEPVEGGAANQLTFTNFGVKLKREDKNFAEFEEMVAKFGEEAFVLNPDKRAHYRTSAGKKELFEELADKYHNTHAATVTGDTVGDPFKDTSGPALNGEGPRGAGGGRGLDGVAMHLLPPPLRPPRLQCWSRP
jgi:hypothetical protein